MRLGLKVIRRAVPAGWAHASSDHRENPPTLMVTLSMPTLYWHFYGSGCGTVASGSPALNPTHQQPSCPHLRPLSCASSSLPSPEESSRQGHVHGNLIKDVS